MLLAAFGGDWKTYEDALYRQYEADFRKARITYDGFPVNLKRHPLSMGRDATFWHLISEGKSEEDRIPDMRRCERIAWPGAILRNANQPAVTAWRNVRGSEERVVLWVEEVDYLVVLAARTGYYVLWTAYLTDRAHTRRKLQKERELWRGEK